MQRQLHGINVAVVERSHVPEDVTCLFNRAAIRPYFDNEVNGKMVSGSYNILI